MRRLLLVALTIVGVLTGLVCNAHARGRGGGGGRVSGGGFGGERPNKSQSFDGKYQLAGTTLVLEYSNGGSMVGKVGDLGERFSFTMVGGPQDDPGLVFSK